VLSGFLVSGLLFQEYLRTEKINAKLFLIRRGFKIYPTFWVVLALNIFYLLYKQRPIEFSQILAELFFVQNFFDSIMGISWSLAIEEHFYFFLILIAIIAARHNWIQKKKVIVNFCLFVLLACLSLRIVVNSLNPFNEWTHLFPTYLRIDSLMFGVLISWFYHFEFKTYLGFITANKYLLFLAIIIGLAFPVIFRVENPIMNTVGLSFLYIAFGAVLCFTESSTSLKSKFFRPLAFVGRYSYAIYLVHLILGPAVANFFRMHVFINANLEWINKTIYLLSNMAGGVFISFLVERPFLKIRDKYFPKPVPKSPLHTKQNVFLKTDVAV
jgi:peptidoglycan/LPS O-acetylase OafA/YrhL